MKKQSYVLILLLLLSALVVAQDEEGDPGSADPITSELLERIEALEDQVIALQEEVAEKEPEISPLITGSATAAWQFNVRTGRSGFYNELETSIEIPIVPDDSAREQLGNGGVRGYIRVEGYSLNLTPGGIEGSEGTIDARVYFDTLYLQLFRAPSTLLTMAPPLEIGGSDINTDNTDVPINGGVSVGYVTRGTSLIGKIGSPRSQLTNNNNQYGVGITFRRGLSTTGGDSIGLEYEIGAAYTAQLGNYKDATSDFKSRDLGLSGKITTILPFMSGLVVSLGTDLALPYNEILSEQESLAVDLRSDLALRLSDPSSVGGVPAWSIVGLAVYAQPQGTTPRIDLGFTFSELEGDTGLIENLGAGLNVGLTDILGTLGWTVETAAQYELSGAEPYMELSYGSSDILEGKFGVVISPIPLLKIDVNYASFNMNHLNNPTDQGDPGLFTVEATIVFDEDE